MDLVIAQTLSKEKASAPSLQTEKSVVNRKFHIQSSGQVENEQQYNHMEDDYHKKQLAVQNLIKSANAKLNLYINNENLKKPYPVTIEVYLIFLRVGEIDNVKERFQTDAFFEACWEDNTIDPKQGFDPRQHWEPELFLENAVANLKQDIKYRVERVGNRTKVYESRMIKGIFWERLELWDFPLDVQNLSITVTSSRNKKEINFVQSKTHESTINTNDFQQQQEWNLYEHIEQQQKSVIDVWNNNERPCITFSSTISRRPGYFLYNAYMLIFLISVLGFVPFSFSYLSPHFRIQTTCLLILSSINFRWIVTQKLPTVSYLTTLDKYAIGALIFLVGLCVWHALIGSSIITSNPSNIDLYALITLAVLYVLFHIVYSAYFIYKYMQYRKIGKSDEKKADKVNLQVEDLDDRAVSANMINLDNTNGNVNFISHGNNTASQYNEASNQASSNSNKNVNSSNDQASNNNNDNITRSSSAKRPNKIEVKPAEESSGTPRNKQSLAEARQKYGASLQHSKSKNKKSVKVVEHNIAMHKSVDDNLNMNSQTDHTTQMATMQMGI